MPGEPRMSRASLKVLQFIFAQGLRAELCGADIRNATGVNSGTLYPLLLRFEKAGWLKSRWEDVDPSEIGRPRKRLYKITGLGASKAKELECGIALGRFEWAFS